VTARFAAAALAAMSSIVVLTGLVRFSSIEPVGALTEPWVDSITPPPTTLVPPTTTTTTTVATTTTMGTVTTVLPAVLPDYEAMLRRQGDGYGLDTDTLIDVAHAACDTSPAQAAAAWPDPTGLLMVAIGVGVLCPDRYDPGWSAPPPPG
jgi:hypothetical protein